MKNFKLQKQTFFLIVLTSAVSSFCSTPELLPREPFSFELPKLVISINDTTGECSKVRINFPGTDDYVIITPFDDIYVKIDRNGLEKVVYRESGDKSYMITDFEAEQVNKVCKGLCETLEQLEKCLQDGHWGRCLYLDAYLPNFLNGFYYLMYLVKNASDEIPGEMKIPEKLYDVSLSSIKSDERIKKWQMSEEHIVKLRISVRELIYQIKTWQKKDLTNRKRNPEISQDAEVLKALVLFERLYFNRDISGKR